MAVIEFNKNPSPRELRVFGILLLVFAAIVGALVRWKLEAPAVAQGVWIAGGLLTVVFFALPAVRRPLYLGWMYAAFPIGFVISHVVLGFVYFVVITPIGLIMRLVGHDPMTRSFDANAATYWVEHDPHRDRSRYFRQF